MGYTKEQREQKKLDEEKKLNAEKETTNNTGLGANETVDDKSQDNINANVKSENTAAKKHTRRKIPLDTNVTVMCNTPGGAVYISRKGGYTVEWDDIGGIEYMELSELQSMRNTDKRFFEDSWIVVVDAEDSNGNEYSPREIYEFLRVAQYYEGVYTPETIEEIFNKTSIEIIRDITPLSVGMKNTISTYAKKKYDADDIDLNIVNALEQALGIQFKI